MKAQLSIEFFTTMSFLLMLLIMVLIVHYQRTSSLTRLSVSDKLTLSCQEIRVSVHPLTKSKNTSIKLSLPARAGGTSYVYEVYPAEGIVISLGEESIICETRTTITNSSHTSQAFNMSHDSTATSSDEVIVVE